MSPRFCIASPRGPRSAGSRKRFVPRAERHERVAVRQGLRRADALEPAEVDLDAVRRGGRGERMPGPRPRGPRVRARARTAPRPAPRRSRPRGRGTSGSTGRSDPQLRHVPPGAMRPASGSVARVDVRPGLIGTPSPHPDRSARRRRGARRRRRGTRRRARRARPPSCAGTTRGRRPAARRRPARAAGTGPRRRPRAARTRVPRAIPASAAVPAAGAGRDPAAALERRELRRGHADDAQREGRGRLGREGPVPRRTRSGRRARSPPRAP